MPLSPGTRSWGAPSSLQHPCSVVLLLPSIWGAEPRRELAKPCGRASPAAGRCLRLSPAVPCSAAQLDQGGSVQHVPCTGCASCSAPLLPAVPCCAVQPPWTHRALLLPAMPCRATPLDAQGTACHAVLCHTTPSDAQPWCQHLSSAAGGIFPIVSYLCSPRCPLDPQLVCHLPCSRCSLPAPSEAPAMQSPSSRPAQHTPIPINPAARRCVRWGPAPVNPGCGDFAPP